MKAIIIDDESRARSALKQEIAYNCPDLIIAGEASGIREAIPVIESLQPDLIFLDIQLSDGLGFELLDIIDDTRHAVIFTTAYSEYALRAFKTNAIDYLLKPIDGEDLALAVRKAAEKLAHPEPPAAGKDNLSILQQKKIILHTSEGLHVVRVNEIVRCNSYGNYTFIFLTDGTRILIARILKDVEESLKKYGFERVHHSHLININQVRSFKNKDGGMLIMNDNSEVPVSQRKRSAFLEQLERLLESKG